MPRSRGSDVPQRQSPRGPHQLRTSSSDSDPPHHRPIADRSPKLGGDRRSPRGGQPEAVNQKKLGTRIADLESQLGQAQEELKSLKNQLASAEAAKREAQKRAEQFAAPPPPPEAEKCKVKKPEEESNGKTETKHRDATPSAEENFQETDVFEVPVEKLAIEVIQRQDQSEKEAQDLTPPEVSDPKKTSSEDESKLKDDEIASLKSDLEEKEKKLESMGGENENLKSELSESVSKIAAAEAKGEEMALRLSRLGEELEARKANAVALGEKLKTAEAEKEALESEMKKLRVQTEQWRKAADAAAAVLAGGIDMGARVPERCGSMDKHFGGGGGAFETPAGGRYNGYLGSPGMGDNELDDGFGSVKRKGSGIRMFGDLWKKKAQK